MRALLAAIKRWSFHYVALLSITLNWVVVTLWELHLISKPNWVYLQYNRTIGIGMLILGIYSLHKRYAKQNENSN